MRIEEQVRWGRREGNDGKERERMSHTYDKFKLAIFVNIVKGCALLVGCI
jgi:hypothetical protein